MKQMIKKLLSSIWCDSKKTGDAIFAYFFEYPWRVITFGFSIVLICLVNVIFYALTLYLAYQNILTPEYVYNNFWLNATNQEPLGLFLSSYSHQLFDGGVHLLENMRGFLLLSALIGTFYIIRKAENNPLPIWYLVAIYSVFLLIFPFIISGIIHLVAFLLQDSSWNCKGFSGIVCATLGVFLYLLFSSRTFLKNYLNAADTQSQNIMRKVGYAVLIILITLWSILSPIINGDPIYGGIGHLTGFLFGFLAAYLFEKFLPKGRDVDRELTENNEDGVRV